MELGKIRRSYLAEPVVETINKKYLMSESVLRVGMLLLPLLKFRNYLQVFIHDYEFFMILRSFSVSFSPIRTLSMIRTCVMASLTKHRIAA